MANKPPEFIGTVEAGRLPRDVERDIDKALAALEGKRAGLVVREIKPKRSLKQNDYFKGFIIPEFMKWAKEQGNNISHEQADEILKRMVGFVELITLPNGKRIEVTKSTAKLEKKPMSDFTAEVIATLAVDWELTLPPERGTEDLYYRKD